MNLNNCKKNIKEININKSKILKELKDINKIISNIDLAGLQEHKEEYDLLVDEYKDLKNNKLKLKELKINHAKKLVDKLDDHEYDPNCKFCVQNPFVQDAESAKKLLPILQAEHDEILTKINALHS